MIMGNRREFRARGLTAADLIVLESIARACPAGMRRLPVAEIARLVGLHRSTALHHVRRLEAFGVVFRLGAAMMVNARSVLSWAADAVKNRALHVKRLCLLRYSQLVGRRLPPRVKKDIPAAVVPDLAMPSPDRASALADLKAAYVPLHLRRCQT